MTIEEYIETLQRIAVSNPGVQVVRDVGVSDLARYDPAQCSPTIVEGFKLAGSAATYWRDAGQIESSYPDDEQVPLLLVGS